MNRTGWHELVDNLSGAKYPFGQNAGCHWLRQCSSLHELNRFLPRRAYTSLRFPRWLGLLVSTFILAPQLFLVQQCSSHSTASGQTANRLNSQFLAAARGSQLRFVIIPLHPLLAAANACISIAARFLHAASARKTIRSL
jgi:hypothetical protein